MYANVHIVKLCYVNIVVMVSSLSSYDPCTERAQGTLGRGWNVEWGVGGTCTIISQ